MPIEHINKTDTLNEGREKLNNAITAFNETVVEGDSSVEAAQARVDEKGVPHPTLKARIDDGLNSVNQQLSQTENEIEKVKLEKADISYVNNSKRDKSIPIGVNDLDGETLGIIQDGTGGTPIEVLSIPRDGSVTAEKTTFIKRGKNLFDKSKIASGKVISLSDGSLIDGTSSFVTDFIPVRQGEVLTINTNYRIGLYDAEKNGVNVLNVEGSDNTASRTITIPEGVSYIRGQSANTTLEYYQIEHGNESTPYEPFKSVLKGVEIEESSLPNIRQLSSFNELFEFVQSKNIFDSEHIILSKSLDPQGNIIDSENYNVMDFTQVDGGETYVANKTSIFVEYGEYDNFLNYTNLLGQTPITFSAETKNIRVAVSKANVEGFQIEKGSESTTYEPFFNPYVKSKNSPNLEGNSTWLTGKKGIAFGDSITMGSTFPNYISDLYNTNFFNAGFGATRLTTSSSTSPYHLISMSHISDAIASGDWTIMQPHIDAIDTQRGDNVYSTIYNQLKQIDFATVDYITIMYGTNDMNYTGLSIGTEESMDTKTINGAINHVMTNILTHYPHIKVYWMSPIFRNGMSGGTPEGNSDEVTTGSLYLYEIAEGIVNACKRLHIPCLDLYNKSGINALTADYYFKDKTHPNDKGNQLLNQKVSGFLSTR